MILVAPEAASRRRGQGLLNRRRLSMGATFEPGMKQEMETVQESYIPALRFDWLTASYDTLIRYFLRERLFKDRLISRMNLCSGQEVLDLGCGTATLSMLIKQLYPAVNVTGMDGDRKILELARSKIETARLDIKLRWGLAHQLDLADKSFDRVVSSLMFHHLTPEHKRRSLSEIYRVLRPGGQLHVADWGKPQSALMRCAFLPVQILDGFAATSDSVRGKLSDYMADTGFTEVLVGGRLSTILGTLTFYQAKRPLDGLRTADALIS